MMFHERGYNHSIQDDAVDGCLSTLCFCVSFQSSVAPLYSLSPEKNFWKSHIPLPVLFLQLSMNQEALWFCLEAQRLSVVFAGDKVRGGAQEQLGLWQILCPGLHWNLARWTHPGRNTTAARIPVTQTNSNTEFTGKTKEGGICFYINKGWCTAVTVMRVWWSPCLETLIINHFIHRGSSPCSSWFEFTSCFRCV